MRCDHLYVHDNCLYYEDRLAYVQYDSSTNAGAFLMLPSTGAMLIHLLKIIRRLLFHTVLHPSPSQSSPSLPDCGKRRSRPHHITSRHDILRPLPSLRCLPVDILQRSLDIASLAMNTTNQIISHAFPYSPCFSLGSPNPSPSALRKAADPQPTPAVERIGKIGRRLTSAH